MIAETADLVRQNIVDRSVIVPPHARKQMRTRNLDAAMVIEGARTGSVIEDYPHDDAGPTVLLLQSDPSNEPIHALWRIEAATAGPAILVTAYRPDPALWSADFRTRRAGSIS